VELLHVQYGGAVSLVRTIESESKRVKLRRAQYGVDPLRMAQWLVGERIGRQLKTLADFKAETERGAIPIACFDALEIGRAMVAEVASVGELLLVEARASKAYFFGLAQWLATIRWTGAHVPESWRTWTGKRGHHRTRATSHTGASHPANAVLNFGYSVAAARVQIALASEGFDTAAGWLHCDRELRASLAWDAVELLRADVERRALALLRKGPGTSRAWNRRDFWLDPKTGIVRLLPATVAAVTARVIPDYAECLTVAALVRGRLEREATARA
jgi:CRISPR-associated protein Cas1